MTCKSLRDWLETVESHGELKHISGADCDLEMAAVAELAQVEGKEPKPLIIFDDIPGYPKGYRTLFGIMASGWRIASGLGLPETDLDRMSLVRSWNKKSSSLRLIPPKLVASGAVQTNVDTGDNVDLLKFPSPRFHELDGGRYFGTCHAVIQKDPDTGYVNLGTYRVMLVDRKHLAFHALEGQHGSMIMHQKYFARGKPMPIAIAIGLDPALWCTSRSNLTPFGVSEYDYAGGIKGEPIEVIEGPVSGLPLPAHAEIVVEGECYPEDLVNEGPFGEWCGYYANLGLEPVPEPLIHVKAVYYRDNPILTCSCPTIPPNDSGTLLNAILSSNGLWRRLQTIGIQGIKGVWCHSEAAGSTMFNVISIEQLYAGHAMDVGMIAAQWARHGKYTVVVDEDIDPTNLPQVIWAIVSREMPDRSIQILHGCRSTSADSAIPPEEKRRYKTTPKPLQTSRAVIIACRPLAWKNDWYPVSRMSQELRAKTLAKWQNVLNKL